MENDDETILDLINKLPKHMVVEWQATNCLPYRRCTIESLINFFNRKLNLNLSPLSFGYTDEVSNVIEILYKKLAYNDIYPPL